MLTKIGFGGSCHWCTEAIFQSLTGVEQVQQGWIASEKPFADFSEAVLVYFDPQEIDLQTLVAVHLHTHSCTAAHPMRSKYRSAIYYFEAEQSVELAQMLLDLQSDFDAPIITQLLPFVSFRLNEATYLDYYYSNPEKPFCTTIIHPKLTKLKAKFQSKIKQ